MTVAPRLPNRRGRDDWISGANVSKASLLRQHCDSDLRISRARGRIGKKQKTELTPIRNAALDSLTGSSADVKLLRDFIADSTQGVYGA